MTHTCEILRSSAKSGLDLGLRYKNNGDEEDLGHYQLDDGDDDSQHTAN